MVSVYNGDGNLLREDYLTGIFLCYKLCASEDNHHSLLSFLCCAHKEKPVLHSLPEYRVPLLGSEDPGQRDEGTRGDVHSLGVRWGVDDRAS